MTERQHRVERGLKPGPEARASDVSDNLVEDRMRLFGVPGMSVTIIDKGDVDWSAAYGTKSGDCGDPVDENTLFQCCSTSKMVASLTALRLVADGKLSLDSNVNDFLGDWQLRDADGNAARVTLRQLLSHTGGVNVHGAPGYARDGETPSLFEVLDGLPPAITAPVRVTTEPGRQFRYSGGGYCVLQLLIELASDTTFENAANAYILGPLGMRNSTFSQPLPEERWSVAASAHCTLELTPTSGKWFVYPEQAVGGLWTTAFDLAQVVLEVQRAKTGEGKVLPADLAKEMVTIHSDNWNAGLGTFVSNPDDPSSAFFSHTGAHLGWHAVAMGYLELGKGAVVLTNNGYTGSELYREYLLSVAEEYKWPNFSGSFR